MGSVGDGLRQRNRRELLRQSRVRTDRLQELADQHRGTAGAVQLPRGLVQPAPQAQCARLPLTDKLREQAQPLISPARRTRVAHRRGLYGMRHAAGGQLCARPNRKASRPQPVTVRGRQSTPRPTSGVAPWCRTIVRTTRGVGLYSEWHAVCWSIAVSPTCMPPHPPFDISAPMSCRLTLRDRLRANSILSVHAGTLFARVRRLLERPRCEVLSVCSPPCGSQRRHLLPVEQRMFATGFATR